MAKKQRKKINAGERSRMLMAVGKKIQKLRLSKKLTIAELAKKTGRSEEFLERVEAGQAKRLLISDLVNICRVVGVKVHTSLEDIPMPK